MSFTFGYFLINYLNIGNKVGIIVGIIPNLNSPPIKSFLLFYNVLNTIRFINNIFFVYPFDLYQLIVGFFVLSKIWILNSSSIFWICILKVGWVTKHFSAAKVKIFLCYSQPEHILVALLSFYSNFWYKYKTINLFYSVNDFHAYLVKLCKIIFWDYQLKNQK
jgi:hypothetical protein